MESETEHSATNAEGARIRLFVAARAPEPVRLAASESIASFRRIGGVRWVSPERLHLTLKFLGNVPAEKTSALEEELRQVANTCLRFTIRLGGIGAFPNTRRPQTIWCGIGGDVDALIALAGRIEAAMEPLGFAREGKPYRPHLTVGRVRSSRGLRELATELEKRAANDSSGLGDEIEWRIDEITLIRSDLLPAGPLYTELARFPLATIQPASEPEQERRAGGQ